MSAASIIKKAGFKTARIEAKHKGVFGGNCNHVIALVNSEGKTLCYEGTPYYPCGRLKAYSALILSGDINAECFSFN